MQDKNIYYFLIGIFLLALNLTSCSTTKFLGENEQLLRGNTINFKKPSKSLKNKPSLKYQLTEFFRQKVNRRFFGIPREWFYYKTLDPGDTTKFDRWIQDVIAEPPAIYNPDLRKETELSIAAFLRNIGYYNVEVFSIERPKKNKKIFVDYYIQPNKRFTVDSISFSSPDRFVQEELNSIENATFFKQGVPLDFSTFEKEKDRITKHLRNNGYAYFYPYSIGSLEADTTVKSKQAQLYLNVDTPPNDSLHKVYFIGDIKVYTNYSPLRGDEAICDTIGGFQFCHYGEGFEVKPKVIADAIHFEKGTLFSQEQYDRTYNQINALGLYKIIRIRQRIDSLRSDQINIQIELTPSKRMELTLDFELNYTNRNASSAITPNLFGLSLSPGLIHKNLLGGAEFSITNLTAGLEFNPTSNVPRRRLWNTVDLGIQTELNVPKFLDYLGIWKLANSIGRQPLYSPKGSFYELLRESGISKFTTGYNYILLLDLYRYNLFNASFGYSVRKSNTQRYLINHVGVDYLEPFVQPAFQTILDNNQFLERSFGQQLFVSLLFRDFNYIYTSRPRSNGESSYFSFNIETAGGEIYALNELTNLVNNSRDTFGIGNTNFSQYYSIETDWRFYKEITPKRGFATRVYAGIARPFGFTSEVPFIKQFAVGGPNSIRAWVERGLGPGGYVDTLAHDPNNRFRLDPDNRLRLYQTGDFKLEFNAEYRFNLYWLLDGAIFLDAGNIWTIKPDPDRCGSMFTFRSKMVEGCEEEGVVNDPFYRQIALGTGLGLRLDLTYFILRLDMGMRLRYPFPLRFPRPEIVNESNYWVDFRGWGINDINFNLGFGYPF